MDNTTNSLNWFEIPVLDMERGTKFYERIFSIKMESQEMGEARMSFFPWQAGSGKATGALVQGPTHSPSQVGAKIYLNANPAMDETLSRVEEAGGKVMVPKTSIGEHGHIAFIIDTEGNQVGLHSID